MLKPKFYGDRDIWKKRIKEYADLLAIDFDLNLRPNQVSGGMLQKVAILRCLLLNAQIILADEPFSALDIDSATEIRSIFRQIIIRENSFCLVGIFSSNLAIIE